MIQEDITDPVDLFTLGDLRQWIARQSLLPDDTPLAMDNPDPDGEEFLVVAIARRSWRPRESGAVCVVQPDGSLKQIEQLVVSLRNGDET